MRLWFTLMFALITAPAFAQEGQIFLTWEDCALDGAGTYDQIPACITNDNTSVLYAAFTLAQPLDDVLGIIATVDFLHSQSQLPDWWHIKGKGDCRDGQLRISGDFTKNGVCADPWQNLGAGEVLYYEAFHGNDNRARIEAYYEIRSDSARTLGADEMYYGIKIVIGNERTIFPGECAGCNQPACLVLASVRLVRGPLSDPKGVGVTLDTPGPGDGNRVVWRGGLGADCTMVPVRAVTWGRIKTLYR